MAFSPDGKFLAIGSASDPCFQLIDQRTKKVAQVLSRFRFSTSFLAFSQDGNLLIGTGIGSVFGWDLTTGKELFTSLPGHWSKIGGLAISTDGKRLATTDEDGETRLWDMDSFAELALFKMPGRVFNPGVAFFSNNNLIAIGKGRYIEFFDVSKQTTYKKFTPPSYFRRFCLSPDNLHLAVSTEEGIDLYEMATFNKSTQILIARTRLPHSVSALAYSPDGKYLTAGRQEDRTEVNTLLQWEVASGRPREKANTSFVKSVDRLAYSPNGKYIVSVGNQLKSTLRLWSAETGIQLHEMDDSECAHPGSGDSYFPNLAAAFSPDSTLILSGGQDGTVRLWDVYTGRLVWHFPAHHASVSSVCWSPNGKRFVTAGEDSAPLVWRSPAEAWRLQRPSAALTPKELQEAWEYLAAVNAAASYKAIERMCSAPAQTVPFLAGQLSALRTLSNSEVKNLVTELSSANFKTRETAYEKLKTAGQDVEMALEEFLKKEPELESRRRLQSLLDEIGADKFPSQNLRRFRTLQVLEWINTGDSRKLLKKLSQQEPRSIFTELARQASQRLERLNKEKE